MTERAALVLDGGSGPALEFVRSLGRAGWRVLAPAGTRAAASRYAAASVVIPDAADCPDGFVDGVTSALRHQEVDAIVPCTDASALALNSRPQATGSACVIGGSPDMVLRLTEKLAGLQTAQRAGFPVPRWGAPSTADEAVEIAQDLGYPCVVKPRRSYVRSGAELAHRRHTVVRDATDLNRAFAALGGEQPPIVQALVRGRALAVGAVRHQGRLLGSVARETFTFHPVAGGTSVWKRTVSPEEAGVDAAHALLADIGYEGLGEVEYVLEADGTPRLMEVGVRAFGWLPLATAAGANLSLLAARAACGEDPEPLTGYRAGVEMRWPVGELLRLRDAQRGALPAGVSRSEVVRSAWPPWRPGMRYDGISRDDWRPWLPVRIRRYAPVIAPATVGAA